MRYKKDLNEIIDNNSFRLVHDKLVYKGKKEIYYYTVHASKGLGFDYVFLINNKKGYCGFPATKKRKGIFKEENVLYEERRLYYVALTRTKNNIYLMYPKRKASTFLKEIKKMLKKK